MEIVLCADTITYLTGLLLNVIQVALFAIPLLRGASRSDFSNFVRRMLLRARRLLSAKQSSSDLLDKLASHSLRLRRMTGARIIYLGLSIVVFGGVTQVLINRALDRPGWMSRSQIWTILVLQTGLMVIRVANAVPALTRRMLDASYALTMLACASFIWCGSDNMMFAYSSAITLRMVCSLGNLQIRIAVVWNLLLMCNNCVRSLYQGQVETPDSVYTSFAFEVFITAVIIFASIKFKVMTFVSIRQEIQVGMLKSESSALMSLLDMLCDVVVKLSSDMTIAQDSQAMAALLLKCPGSSIAGRSFLDFMPDEAERRSLEDKLAALGDGSEASVGSCRVHFSDSLNNPVSAEVFFVKVHTFGEEECRYILGVREFTDVMAALPSIGQTQVRVNRRRESNKRGTPHDCEHLNLQARDQAECQPPPDAQASPRQRTGSFRWAGLVETRQDVKCQDLVISMSSWNIKIPRTVCCPFHAYVMEAKATIRDGLSRIPCTPDFPDSCPTGKQCQTCGIFHDPDVGECTMCGSRQLKLVPNLAEGM